MDDELAPGSPAPTGTSPTGSNLHDWNTGLAGPAPDAGSVSGTADTQFGGEGKPEWRDPSAIPGVQRAFTGAFGEKLRVLADAAGMVQAVLESTDLDSLSDAEVVAFTQTVENAGRPVDAARVGAATVVGYRSRPGLGRDSMAWRLGASHQSDLLTRLTLASRQEMKRRLALGEKVAQRMLAGQVLEPEFPAVAAAMRAGELGIDAAETIVKGLADYKVHGRFDADQADVESAELGLVERATGSVFDRTRGPGDSDIRCTGPILRRGDSEGFTYPADDLRSLAARMQALLNPDGAAPNATTVEAKSTISFGELTRGLYPLRGGVTPVLKGVIQNLFNTFQSARSAPRFPSAQEQQRIEAGELVPGELIDERTGGEKRADILRGILVQVAQDPRTPTMGGMPPTVMVHVNAADLLKDAGVGWIDGVDGPVSMKTITQMIDNGGFQPVFFGRAGAVLGLGSKARCFSPMQRKMITARDGGCIIPGCDCPPQWTEVHHVVPWQVGGKTHASNGVLLCWYHHHTIDSSGWRIRMVGGRPRVMAPHWIDPSGTWRTPGKHRAHDPKTRPQDE
ncbi:HNH endonuclease signature motif containing protein [Cryobacterium sp. TMB1-7]|uniref:HNH endonuclease signature motif containing protein n=1 Tax=Cryobacterium sp. TMB1-7 TaxID=2555866 RepID=UPI00106D27B9|nr:HNH endonuclease signature motif containing protein [Cryobacterium sp. TMB1-7]TFC57579.1 HNH endonuclease [Cryobacterium sp. TMB1-7]